jgi:hypothetical protein
MEREGRKKQSRMPSNSLRKGRKDATSKPIQLHEIGGKKNLKEVTQKKERKKEVAKTEKRVCNLLVLFSYFTLYARVFYFTISLDVSSNTHIRIRVCFAL